MLMDRDILQAKFEQALSYEAFVKLGEPEGHRPPWDQRYGQLTLTDDQDQLVKSFSRTMHVLCMSGTWCGDCALQGAAMQRIAEANQASIRLRYLLRCEQHADLAIKAPINKGFRVPITWFMADDFEPIAWFGDRTLSRYRSIARKTLSGEQTAALPEPPDDPVREVLGEMMDEFERVHLLLRLSPRMRAKHDD